MVGIYMNINEVDFDNFGKKKLTKTEFKNHLDFFYKNKDYSIGIMHIKMFYSENAIKNFLKKYPEYMEYFI
jgi:hypothetical protein